jgi:hypothetical protein
MEYFLGSAVTMVAMFITTRLILPRTLNKKVDTVRYSQSHIHTLVVPLLPDMKTYKKKIVTQSSKHDERINIKVVIVENKAYFVKDGSFYCADMDGDYIDKQTAAVVDTMGMDKVQLDKMLFIMDQLRDGKKNDSGDSRNQ